jgi:hypothetical protein
MILIIYIIHHRVFRECFCDILRISNKLLHVTYTCIFISNTRENFNISFPKILTTELMSLVAEGLPLLVEASELQPYVVIVRGDKMGLNF